MPANLSPLGALPARFRKPRVLIVGCGDVGMRVAALLRPRMAVLALTSSPGRVSDLRTHSIVPLQGNLDDRATLARLAGIATHVVYLAPPPTHGWTDPRSQALLQALRRRALPTAVVYGSTTGVYGDCQGAWVNEVQPCHPSTPRAVRRVHAEQHLRFWARSTGVRTSILRIPGIYAKDRPGGTPRERLLKGMPVLQAQDDVYTNHIHADDLARACMAALWRGAACRTYNVSDDTELKMGDYFDVAADILGLPRPPRVSRHGAQAQLPVMLLSFMAESRRLVNLRMKTELGVRLGYPTVREGLA